MTAIDPTLLVLLVPLAVIELGLLVAALWDLSRPGRRVRGDSRLVWALVILFVNFIGPILYFVAGREDVSDEPEEPRPAPDARPGWVAPARTPDRSAPAPGGPPSVAAAPAAVEPSASVGSSVAATPAAVEPSAPVESPAPVEPSATLPVVPARPLTPAPMTAPTPTALSPTARPAVDAFSLPGAPVRDLPARRPLAPGEAAVSARGLTKRFGSGAGSVLALDRLDLEVPAGSVFGLLGPNGAGKTTCLRILSGLARPTAGNATVAGVGVDGGGPALTRRIGYLDQDPRYYGWMTGRELITMVGRLQGIEGYRVERRAIEVLEQVGLADAADRRVGTYSGGMRQRLGIAQAMVNRPSLLILDEPVSSLDPEGRRDLLMLIAELRGTSTVLFSTHVLADVERICDRVAILDHGRLVTEGALDALLDRYALPIYRLEPEPDQDAPIAVLVERLRAADWVTDVTAEHGIVRVTVADPGRASRELLPAVVEASVALAAYERVRPTLEDVFLELVGRDRPGNAA